jgi:hypothetical protein
MFAWIVGLVVLAQVLPHLLGPGAEFLVFVGIAAIAIYATVRNEVAMSYLARLLKKQPNVTQSLVNLENSQVRKELAVRLAAVAPRVPLRGPAERFQYPPSTYAIMRGMALVSLPFFVLIVFELTRKPLAEVGSIVDVAAGLLVFGGGGLFFAYGGWVAIAEIEITDEYIAMLHRGRMRKQLWWSDVTLVRQTNSGVAVRGPTTTIRFSYVIGNYGRLTNLALTRWKAPA